MEAVSKEKVNNNEGLIRNLVTLSTNLSETTVETTFGAAQDLRENAVRRVRGLVDWVESAQQSNIDIARKLTGRADHLAQTVLQTGERALRTLIQATRETGHGVADVAARSAGSFVSKAPPTATLS